MIYFYWITGLGFAITAAVLVSCLVDNREDSAE